MQNLNDTFVFQTCTCCKVSGIILDHILEISVISNGQDQKMPQWFILETGLLPNFHTDSTSYLSPTYISLLIIPCMIVYVTNNKNLEPWTWTLWACGEPVHGRTKRSGHINPFISFQKVQKWMVCDLWQNSPTTDHFYFFLACLTNNYSKWTHFTHTLV